MRTIAISGFKGGVGKTTTAVNLAVGIARQGISVLLVDADSQHNCTDTLGVPPDTTTGLYGLLTGSAPIEETIVQVEPHLSFLPASRALSSIDGWLLQRPRPSDVLKKRLKGIQGYEFVILDLPPSFGSVTLNCLMFATEVWLPVSMEYLALQGVKQVLDTLKMLREEADHTVKVGWVIPTFHDRRNSKTASVMKVLEENFKNRVTPPVRTSVRLSEAPGHHQTIWDYAPDSSGSEDYRAIMEVITHAAN